MPHVFTLEGADLGEQPANRPAAWPSLWTTESAQDLTQRLQRLPLMRRPPAPGLGHDETVYYTYGSPLGPHVAPIGPARVPIRVYDVAQFNDATEFLRKQNPVLATLLVFGASLAVSLAVGSAAVWALQRTGYQVER